MLTITTYLQTSGSATGGELAAIARNTVLGGTTRAIRSHGELVREELGCEQRRRKNRKKQHACLPIFPGLKDHFAVFCVLLHFAASVAEVRSYR